MNIDDVKDILAFWRWPSKVRSLSTELSILKAEHEALKVEHQKVVTGQVALLSWVKTTHRLHRAPEGIRALIQEGRRIIPLLFMLLIGQCLFAAPPPILRNSWTTNTAGNPVVGNNNLSVTNASAAGTNWAFFGIGPSTIARLTDVTNIASSVAGASGLTTNANQFLGVPLSIKDAVRMTNISLYNTTTVASADSPLRFATVTNVHWLLRPGSSLVNGVTNYTLELGWNADGANAGEPSFEMEFEATYRDPAGLDHTEWYIQRGDPDGHFYRPLFIQQRRNGYSNAIVQVRGNFDVYENGDITNNSQVILSVNASNQVITTSSNLLVRGVLQVLGSSAAQASLLILPNGMANGATIDMDNGDPNLYFYNRENGNIYFAANAQIGLTLTPAKRVGIGTLSPEASLDVVSNVWIRGLAGQADPGLRLIQTNGRGYVEFTTTNSVISTNQIVLSIGSNTVSADQVLKVHSTAIAGGINRIVLTNDVDNSGGGGGLTTNANQFLGVPLAIKDGATLSNTVLHGGVIMTNSDGQPLVLQVDATATNYAFVVSSNGNVAIGTNDPSQVFTVVAQSPKIYVRARPSTWGTYYQSGTSGSFWGANVNTSTLLRDDTATDAMYFGLNVVNDTFELARTPGGGAGTFSRFLFLDFGASGSPFQVINDLAVGGSTTLTNEARALGGITVTNSAGQNPVLRVDSTATTNALSVGSNGIVSIKGSSKVINIGETTSPGVTGFGVADASPDPPSLSSSGGLFGDGSNFYFNYPAPGGDFLVTAGGSTKVSVGRNTDGFVGIGIGTDTAEALLTVGSGGKFQVDADGDVRTHQSITITNLPGSFDPYLRLAQTNGRGWTEFTVTNSVISTNSLVLSIGSNTVAAGQVFKVHSTDISGGVNRIVLTNDTDLQGGGGVGFGDLVWTNEDGNLHPLLYPASLEISNNFVNGKNNSWRFQNAAGDSSWLTYSNALAYPTLPEGADIGGQGGLRSVFFDSAGNVYGGITGGATYWLIENGGNAMFASNKFEIQTSGATIQSPTVGLGTGLTQWRGTNGATGLLISSNGLALVHQRLDASNAVAFRTNFVDFKLNTYQALTNALQTNLVLQLTNTFEGVTTRFDAYGAGRLGNGRTNAWQLLCTVASGVNIYWPPGVTNGNYDVLVNSNQVVSFTFMGGLGSTNILASYRVLEGIGAN